MYRGFIDFGCTCGKLRGGTPARLRIELGEPIVHVAELFKIVRDINRSGTSILLVEQNVRAAMRISDYSYVLERGSIVAEGAGEALLQSDVVQKSYLGTI